MDRFLARVLLHVVISQDVALDERSRRDMAAIKGFHGMVQVLILGMLLFSLPSFALVAVKALALVPVFVYTVLGAALLTNRVVLVRRLLPFSR